MPRYLKQSPLAQTRSMKTRYVVQVSHMVDVDASLSCTTILAQKHILKKFGHADSRISNKKMYCLVNSSRIAQSSPWKYFKKAAASLYQHQHCCLTSTYHSRTVASSLVVSYQQEELVQLKKIQASQRAHGMHINTKQFVPVPETKDWNKEQVPHPHTIHRCSVTWLHLRFVVWRISNSICLPVIRRFRYHKCRCRCLIFMNKKPSLRHVAWRSVT